MKSFGCPRVRLLTTADRDWAGALDRVRSDVYFRADYHRACEANGDGEARLFVAEDEGELFAYPILLRRVERVGRVPVSDEVYDVESAYGYTGPLATTDDRDFLDSCWKAFGGWSAERRVVAEFARLNPLLENERFVSQEHTVLHVRDSVLLRLDRPPDELWDGYPSVHRNMVRRALREGLEARQLERSALPEFVRLYRETMDRASAAESYYFDDGYFEELGDRAILFGVLHGVELVAAGLFLAGVDTVHYHLAGSTEEGRRFGAGNLVLHAAAEWGSAGGYRWLHLGGGRTGSPDDSLFRFKLSVSRIRRPVYVATRIHDAEAYAELCERWLEQRNGEGRPQYFLLYRLDPLAVTRACASSG